MAEPQNAEQALQQLLEHEGSGFMPMELRLRKTVVSGRARQLSTRLFKTSLPSSGMRASISWSISRPGKIIGQEASDLATNLFAFSCNNWPFGTCISVFLSSSWPLVNSPWSKPASAALVLAISLLRSFGRRVVRLRQ
jgi:hypothetical protein